MPSALRESMGSMGGEMGSISSATAVDRNGPLPWPRLQGDGAVSISPIHIRIKGNRRLRQPRPSDTADSGANALDRPPPTGDRAPERGASDAERRSRLRLRRPAPEPEEAMHAAPSSRTAGSA